MKNKAYNEQIDAYLDNVLSLTEKQAFETALSLDADLQESVRWHRLANRALTENAQDDFIRAVADNVRQRIGKLPDPKPELGFLQRLLNWVKTPFGIVCFLSLVAVIGVLCYANTMKSATELVSLYAFKPADPRVAGNKTEAALSNEDFLKELSTVYFTETPEKVLEKLNILRGALSPETDSLRLVLVDYYGAHANLRSEQYAPAQILFTSVIEQQAFLKNFSVTSDLGKLRFNQILAQLALNHNEKEAILALDSLSKMTGTKGEVQERCKDLTLALSQPMRRFKVF
jgi:hypothetical protein